MKRRHFLALTLLPTLAFAHSSKFGDISIGHAWSLPTASAETQVMMPLLNAGKMPDALVSASSPIATSVELRNGSNVVSEFTLDPNKPFPMRAKANHFQVLGLTKPLLKDDVFPLTLKFKAAGEVEIKIFVAEHPGE